MLTQALSSFIHMFTQIMSICLQKNVIILTVSVISEVKTQLSGVQVNRPIMGIAVVTTPLWEKMAIVLGLPEHKQRAYNSTRRCGHRLAVRMG